MKTRRRNVSDDRLTIPGRNTRSKSSVDSGENPFPIPIDLIFEIFSRLPTKSIAKCRCVSKLWASILLRPDFTELFLTKSSAQPQLLISSVKDGELFLFSSPQVQNQNENSSIVATTNYHTKFPVDSPSEMYGHVTPVHGLVFLSQIRIFNGKKETVPVIYNPSTGQSLPLPRLKTMRTSVISYFGYDPIDKQYKVLSLTWPTVGGNRTSEKHRVLTLGTKKLSWRMVECFPHFPAYNGICIDGVLYYLALLDGPPRCCAVACFDIRSEKYRFVNRDADMALFSHSTLVNYKGKLGALLTGGTDDLTKESTCFELWVLVDAEKHEWSKHVYTLPDSWKDVIGDDKSYFWREARLYFVGVTCTNEVVLSPRYLSDAFYVFYYSLERKTIKRVEIQGMDAFKDSKVSYPHKVNICLNHVEDVKLMQGFRNL